MVKETLHSKIKLFILLHFHILQESRKDLWDHFFSFRTESEKGRPHKTRPRLKLKSFGLRLWDQHQDQKFPVSINYMDIETGMSLSQWMRLIQRLWYIVSSLQTQTSVLETETFVSQSQFSRMKLRLWEFSFNFEADIETLKLLLVETETEAWI